MKKLMLTLIIFGMAAVSWADSASIMGGSGGTVKVFDNQSVQMLDEVVDIRVKADRVLVRVTYAFKNATDQAMKVKMGFPEENIYEESAKLQNFTTSVDGQAVKTQFVKGPDEGETINEMYWPPLNWYTFEVDFAPGQTRSVTNEYWAWSTEYRGLWSSSYMLRTGATWKGPIVSGKVIISLDPGLSFPPSYLGDFAKTEPDHFSFSEDGKSAIWYFNNLEPGPEHDIIITYLHDGYPFMIEPSASSVLPDPDQEKYPDVYYDPWAVHDGRMDTAWVEGEKGAGMDQYVQLDVLDGEMTVNGLGIVSGYKKGNLFKKNNRLKKARVEFSDGTFQDIEFRDTDEIQRFDFSPVTTTFVKLIIKEVYPGTKYDDTAVSEILIYIAD